MRMRETSVVHALDRRRQRVYGRDIGHDQGGRMRKYLASLMVVAMSLAIIVATSATSSATETWSRVVDCNMGNVCAISTTSTTGSAVRHEIASQPVAYWATGGYRTSNTSRSTNTMAGAWTAGYFSRTVANCYCPSGRTCGA